MNPKRVTGLIILCIAVFAVTLFVGFRALTRDLPTQTEIRSTILGRYPTRGSATWVPLYRICPKLQQAVITWEDPTFYFHDGFNRREIIRSVFRNLRAGAYVRGGSTITQQVAKNMYLTREKTIARKLKEAVLTARIEAELNKKEILEIYLNIAEWGPGVAGAEQAARHHLRKPAADLTWAEAALLAGMLQNPSRFDPERHPEAAREKQLAVLQKLLLFGNMTEQEYREACASITDRE